MEDQFAHLVKQAAAQQTGGDVFFRYGHVASYDPVTHRVRVVVPTWRDENGDAVLTGPLPLASIAVGSFVGLQVAPVGGATLTNPTGGEQVGLQLLDRNRGVLAVPALFWTDAMLPPSGQIAGGLLPGEALMRHATGTLWRMHANGDYEVITAGKTIVTATGDVTVTTQANATVTATGSAVITAAAATIVAGTIKLCAALADTLQSLCTAAFATWAEGHVHADPQGGFTGAPTTTPPSNALTSIVTAE